MSVLNSSTLPDTRNDLDTIQELMNQASRGDATVLPRLRQYFERYPEIWQEVGDLGRQAEFALINLAAGTNLVQREAILKSLVQLKAELAGLDDGKLEELLVTQVALCWLDANYSVTREAQTAKEPLSVAQRDHLQRRVERAQRRLVSVIRSLATVRKLNRPSLSPLEIARRPVSETACPTGKGEKQNRFSARSELVPTCG